MSWIGWVVIGIVGANMIFFGTLAICSFIEDWRLKRKNEQR
jgi:hypothetical protein